MTLPRADLKATRVANRPRGAGIEISFGINLAMHTKIILINISRNSSINMERIQKNYKSIVKVITFVVHEKVSV